jgi:general secretion pathway protein K
MNCKAGFIPCKEWIRRSPKSGANLLRLMAGCCSSGTVQPASGRGFALLLVIWILALLAVLAAGVAADSRSGAIIARNRLTTAQARGLADAGVALAILGLIDPNPATRWHAEGRPQSIQYGDGTARVAVQDEGGKIDLNTAPIELIGGLLDELGVEPDERSAITNGILERRREFAPPNTFQASRAGLFGSPAATTDIAKRPFADASELRMIPGVTRATYERILPFVTVYSSNFTVNPLTAPREVLLGIPGINPQEVDFLLAFREQSIANVEKPPLSGVDRYVSVADLSAATIIAKATTGSGATFAREAVAAISPNLAVQPYRILRWRQAYDRPATEEPTTAP